MTTSNQHVPPNQWSRRQGIIILDPDDLDRLYDEGGKDIIRNREISALITPLDKNNEVVRNIIDAGLDREGVMLMQNPFYPDRYEEMSKAPQKFALEKYFITSTLCRHLGAKKITIEEIEKRTSSRVQTLKLEGRIAGGSGGITGQKEELDEVLRKLEMYHEFPGGEPNIKEAEDLLRRTRLIHDVELYTLIEMRKGTENRVQTRRLTIDLSDETNNLFQIIGNVSIPQYLTKIKASYKQVNNEKTEYRLTVLVEF